MALPVVCSSLYCASEATLLKMKLKTILLHYADSTYPVLIPDLNEYILESHKQLVQNITGLLQDNFISLVVLNYI